MKVSVIIPVYKVEKYLCQCVDSVVNQRLYNVEIILVDDGSPDGCPQICDIYQEKYDCIKVIHKPNGGSSSARNAGIAAASGEYIMFMDSDDWWNPNVDMGEVFAQVEKENYVEMFLLTSLDYVEGEGYFKRTEHEKLHCIRTDTVEHYYEDLLNNGNLEVHAATKILKTDFIISNGLFFKSGITSEDNEWILRLLRVLKTVRIIDKPIYMYRAAREGSITSTIGVKNIKDMLNTISSSISYYDGNKQKAYVMRCEYCYCAYIWFCALGLSARFQRNDFNELKHMFMDTASVCTYSNSPKTKAAYKVYKYFGIGMARFALGAYLKLKHVANLNKKKQEKA